MTYREFVSWCNERACDGCWDFDTATLCCRVIDIISQMPFWRRKKAWREIKDSVENVVSAVNKRYGEAE